MRKDPSAGLKVGRQIPIICPGRLVLWLKSRNSRETRNSWDVCYQSWGQGWTRGKKAMCLQVTFLIFLSFLSLITNLLASLSVPPSKHVLKSHLSSPQANLCHFSPRQPNHLLQLVLCSCFLIHSLRRQQRNLLQLVLDLCISFPLFLRYTSSSLPEPTSLFAVVPAHFFKVFSLPSLQGHGSPVPQENIPSQAF